MGNNKSGSKGRKRNKTPTSVTVDCNETRSSRGRRRRRRRRIVWLSGVAGAVLASVLATGIISALSSGIRSMEGLGFSSPPRGAPTPYAGSSSAPQLSTSSKAGTPAAQGHSPICSPLKMVSEYPLNDWEVRPWIFPTGYEPSPLQIAQINKDRAPDLVNRDLYNDDGYTPSTDTQLILQNQCSHPVTITDIQALKSCQATLDGTIFAGQAKLEESSLDDDGTQLGLYLDSPNPEAMVANGWNVSQWNQEYASGPLVAIQGNGTYGFDIRAIALHVACRFSILVRFVYDGKTFNETINDGGQPFRVSALLPGVLKPYKPGDHPYAGYGILYVGGDASPWHDGTWAREDPKTWQLAGPLSIVAKHW
jgi:hypothetical protein